MVKRYGLTPKVFVLFSMLISIGIESNVLRHLHNLLFYFFWLHYSSCYKQWRTIPTLDNWTYTVLRMDFLSYTLLPLDRWTNAVQSLDIWEYTVQPSDSWTYTVQPSNSRTYILLTTVDQAFYRLGQLENAVLSLTVGNAQCNQTCRMLGSWDPGSLFPPGIFVS